MSARSNVEIERKFLVHPEHLPELGPGSLLVQGYLAYKPSVRVRVADDRMAWLTVKGPGDIERAEFEYEIPVADGLHLLTLCEAQIRKVRYRLSTGLHVWEVDRFGGAHAGLYLAEIELSTPDEAFDKPSFVGREVTHDGRYTNAALARAGRVPES